LLGASMGLHRVYTTGKGSGLPIADGPPPPYWGDRWYPALLDAGVSFALDSRAAI
jgi:hypothetical protein